MLAKVKVDPHAKNKVKDQTVQTGEFPQQTDTHAHARTNGRTRTHTDATKRIISPGMRSITS